MIRVLVKNAQQAVDLKDQVVLKGLRIDIDYCWRYTPPVNNWLGNETITPGTVEFDFKDSQWATYFQLKWAQ
jgi:hypothetical protein